MKAEKTLNVAAYTDTPIGRDGLDGPKNGADYRDNYVIPALEEYVLVKLDFTETLGTTPSFLEEIFGGIIRKGIMPAEDLLRRTEIIYKYDSVKKNVAKYINEASKNKQK